MPRTNSLSDSEGRSITPDLEEVGIEGASPTYGPNHNIPFGSAHVGHALTHVLSRKSHRTHRTHQSTAPIASPSAWKNMTPIERFRAAARKIIALRRGASMLGEGRRFGAEPGIDPLRPEADLEWADVVDDCKIEVFDYSAVSCYHKQMNNAEFVDMMDDDDLWKPKPWAKCRWINIGGVSWDVIKALAGRYALHPLAVEDVLQHQHKGGRSKADYYSKHLFLRVICHELRDPNDTSPRHYAPGPRVASPEPMESPEYDKVPLEESADGETLHASYSKSRNSTARRRPLLPRTNGDLPNKQGTVRSQLASLLEKEKERQAHEKENQAAEAVLKDLKKGQGVELDITPMFIFLYRDGTVITINVDKDLSLTAPISTRLQHRDSVLRQSSTTLYSYMPFLTLALEVVDAYHRKINSFEQKVLLRPDVKTVKELHVLAGHLILHKRTLDPIKTMIFGLRRYDVDRCAALIDMSDPANANVKVVGYMSHKSKIYLADVYDHIDYVLTSLDMFTGIGENLIDYTFNLASYEMNETMRRLTLATIIFLPLTLLTGYFGMNFDPMWSVQQNSDVLFWIIALPVMAIVIPVFLLGDIKRMFHYLIKRMSSRRVEKVQMVFFSVLFSMLTELSRRRRQSSRLERRSRVQWMHLW
ncbi:hypothetical protein NMY22_g17217 [Coprinellus aureogranulatus]|nr:hypothetical protein NMY22_g17217 [Coprinellus aureogranulatus]